MDINDTPSNTLNHSAPASEPSPAKSVQRRRRYTIEQKRHIVQDALGSGESFSVAARRHNINANLLFKWRQQYEKGQLDPDAEASQVMPVTITPEHTQVAAAQQSRFPRQGRLEITLASGHRLAITGSPCTQTLRIVLEGLAT